MKFLRSLGVRCGLLAVLTAAFYFLAPTEAQAAADAATPVALQTEDGILRLTMAEYLPGAIAAEMPVSFGPEALKAQAVAIRSYVLASHRHEGADVCDDSGCCLAYCTEAELRARWGRDFDKNLRLVRRAAEATDGQYLAYGDRPIQAVFHASSAGATEDSAAVWSALPYLVSVESPETEETVPGLTTENRFSPEELAARLGLISDAPPEDWLGTAPDGSPPSPWPGRAFPAGRCAPPSASKAPPFPPRGRAANLSSPFPAAATASA